jgi:hypothetical protein
MNEFLSMKMEEAKKNDMTLEKIFQHITSIEAKINFLLEENASLKEKLSSAELRLEITKSLLFGKSEN